MKKSIIFPLALLALASCSSGPTSPWCTFIGPVDSTIVNGIASVGKCTHPDQILATFQSIEKCTIPAPTPIPAKVQMAGPVSTICSMVAPSIVGAIVPTLANAAIPATWGCDPSFAVATLTADAMSLCGLIPVAAQQPK